MPTKTYRLKNARKLRNLDEVGDTAKAAQNSALRNQGKTDDVLQSTLSCSTSTISDLVGWVEG